MRFQLQTAQHVGDLAAELARVQRVAPQFRQHILAQALALVLLQYRSDFGLATGHQHHEFRLLLQGEMDGVIGGRVARMQGRDDVDLLWQQV